MSLTPMAPLRRHRQAASPRAAQDPGILAAPAPPGCGQGRRWAFAFVGHFPQQTDP